jgi:uncharacterized Fe-S cluster protein YjdI
MEKETSMKYSNDEITVVWKPTACIHSKLCWKELSNVFKPAERPWIKIEAASSEKIMAQIDKCPSGALSYYRNGEEITAEKIKAENIVEVSPNGPLLVYGNIGIKHPDGTVSKKNKVTAFCRCGQSANKPYCDGTHTKAGFRD